MDEKNMAESLQFESGEAIAGVENCSGTAPPALSAYPSAPSGGSSVHPDANGFQPVGSLTAAGIFDEVRRRLAILGHAW
jgi:hypothetical protein